MIYVFGAYEFDTDRRVLCVAGTPVDLEPKVFDLLAYLIQHHDQFVSREKLYAQLWSQQFVSEAALTYCISEARKRWVTMDAHSVLSRRYTVGDTVSSPQWPRACLAALLR